MSSEYWIWTLLYFIFNGLSFVPPLRADQTYLSYKWRLMADYLSNPHLSAPPTDVDEPFDQFGSIRQAHNSSHTKKLGNKFLLVKLAHEDVFGQLRRTSLHNVSKLGFFREGPKNAAKAIKCLTSQKWRVGIARKASRKKNNCPGVAR